MAEAGLYVDGELSIAWQTLIDDNYLTVTDGVLGYGENEALYDLAGVLQIDESVTSIGEGTFTSCGSLTEIVLPSGIVTIEDEAFYSCSGLTKINIPEGVVSIGARAFYNCTALTALTLPNSVENLGVSVFDGCKAMTTLTLSDGLHAIPEKCLRNCSALTALEIPDGVSTIGANAFYSCKALTSLTFPDTVTGLGDSVCAYCSGLTEVTLPADLTSLPKGTLQSCSALTSVTIPSGVTSIGSQCFYQCKKLTEIVLPSGLTEIGSWCFSTCTSIASIVLPAGISNIPTKAFKGCSALTQVNCQSMSAVPTLENVDAFNTVADGCKVIVPAKLYDSWKSADVWADLTTATITTGIERVSVDLTTLEGWDDLAAGEHTITVTALQNGKRESKKSTGVTVTKEGVEPLTITPASLMTEQTTVDDYETMTAVISGGIKPYTVKESMNNIAVSIKDDTLTITHTPQAEDGSEETGKVIITDAVGTSISISIVTYYNYCLTGDTLITMADGTQKRIDQIQRGEYVLSIDSEGNEVPGYVYYSDSDMNKMHNHYDRFVFSDGTEVKVVHRHRFYNMEEQKMVYLDQWYIGDHALKRDGSIVELSEIHLRDYEGDPINHYTIFCDHNTYFANGVLCGNRFSDELKLGEPAQVDENGNVVEEPKEYYPVILNLPCTFEGYTDAWLDDETKDLMLVKDGRTINYYQIGYENSYGALYKRPEGTTGCDYDDILNNWEKVAELTHEHSEGNVQGKSWDVIVLYIERVARGGILYKHP